MADQPISQDQVPAISSNPQSNFQFARLDVVLENGNNDDIATGYNNYLRVTGPSAAFAIRGFAGGVRGAVLYVEIDIAQPLTIANLNPGSLVGNQIVTGTGADISIATPCVLQFVYNDDYADYGAWVFRENNTMARALISATEPTTVFTGLLWFDTSTSTLKVRIP